MSAEQIQRGDIFYIKKFSVPNEVEFPGRPAVIVSNDRGNRASRVVQVVYLTTQPKRKMAVHVPINSSIYPSTALCEQITTVGASLIVDYYGHVTDEEMEQIERAMCVALDLKCDHPCSEPTPPPTNGAASSVFENTQTTELSSLRAERDAYKQMYDALLSRLLEK